MGPGHTLMAMCSWMLMVMRSPLRPLMQHPWLGEGGSRELEPGADFSNLPVCWLRARRHPPGSVGPHWPPFLGAEGEGSLCPLTGRQKAWALQTPSCAPWGWAASPLPPDRSWLHLSLAHFPLDCPSVLFPAPAPHSGLLSALGPLPLKLPPRPPPLSF